MPQLDGSEAPKASEKSCMLTLCLYVPTYDTSGARPLRLLGGWLTPTPKLRVRVGNNSVTYLGPPSARPLRLHAMLDVLPAHTSVDMLNGLGGMYLQVCVRLCAHASVIFEGILSPGSVPQRALSYLLRKSRFGIQRLRAVPRCTLLKRAAC